MPAPDLVIFDCDGVLVDSEIVAARVDAELITAAGHPISVEEIAERYAGLTFRDILLAVEKESNIPLQASLIEDERRMLDRRLEKEVRAIDGAAAAIAGVPYPKCICSNSSRARLDMMLGKTGLLPLFSRHIFSAVDTPGVQSKPAPDIFRHAAKEMGADPERTFVLEDSVHGIHGAVGAGMRVIGFTGGGHSWPGHADKLTEAGAETVINRMSDLNAVIRVLSDWRDV